MSDKFVVAYEEVLPGQHRVIRVPITVDLDGGEVNVWVHVIAGLRPGPTLMLTGVQHGDEWQVVELVRRVVEGLDPAQMSGQLIAIPVCSPVALGAVTRVTQPASDGPDLNRVYPGKYNWIPEQTAKVLSRDILPHADALIDFHFGIWGNGIGIVSYGTDYPDPSVSERSRQMALAYGYPAINRGQVVSDFPGPRSLTGYVGAQLRVPAIAAEIGLAGFDSALEERYLAINERGVRNVMRHMGILAGRPEVSGKALVYEVDYRVEPTKGGLLIPARKPDELGRHVQEGETLGWVLSPYSFNLLETLAAPCTGILTLIARTHTVRPGDWAYGVADTTAPSSEWIEL